VTRSEQESPVPEICPPGLTRRGLETGLRRTYTGTKLETAETAKGRLRGTAPVLDPTAILFFGIGEFPKVLLIFLTSMLYIILNTSAGVLSVPQELIRVGLNLGLTRLQLFRSVMFPASLPYVMTGIRTATAVSWALVVAAELVAAQEGLGYMVMDAATFFRVADVYISIGIIGAIGLALELVEGLVEAHVLHWRGR